MSQNQNQILVTAVEGGQVEDIREGEYGEKLVIVKSEHSTVEYVTDLPLAKRGQVVYKNTPLGTVDRKRVR